MLTDDDVIADLSRLRERSAGIEYTGEVPLTRRSLAATVVPVAAVAAVATLGAAAVVGSGDSPGTGSVAGPGAGPGGASATGTTTASPDAPATSAGSITLVSATLTLGSRTIAYRHAVGQDPFGDGWQLAVDFGQSLPADATRFDLGGGELAWVADAPASSGGQSVLIVTGGPDEHYIGAPSSFSRADLEDFVRTNLHGQ